MADIETRRVGLMLAAVLVLAALAVAPWLSRPASADLVVTEDFDRQCRAEKAFGRPAPAERKATCEFNRVALERMARDIQQ